MSPGEVSAIEDFVQWLWSEDLIQHVVGRTVTPDYLLRTYLGDAPAPAPVDDREALRAIAETVWEDEPTAAELDLTARFKEAFLAAGYVKGGQVRTTKQGEGS